jgi:hypothetical protein
MRRSARRSAHASSKPLSDRDRTVFAATEAVVGALLAVAGVLLLGVPGLGAAASAALIVLGVMAVAQSVAVGLGLVTMPSGGDDSSDHDH